MSERPILFTPYNAQLVHTSQKSQTRRIVKEHPPYLYVEPNYDGRGAVVLRTDQETGSYAEYWPYGRVGDRLWVRESFEAGYDQSCGGPMLLVAFDGSQQYKKSPDAPHGVEDWCLCWKRMPSIHMPRWACRTVLEITEIRVERLQDISLADIISEGISPDAGFGMQRCPNVLTREWIDLWESINGHGSWADNPYVWCLSFRKVA